MLITTKTLAATNTRGTRVKATAAHYQMSVTIPWDYSRPWGGGYGSMHYAAALALCLKFNASPHAEFAGRRETLRFVGSTDVGGYAYDAQGAYAPTTYDVYILDDGDS